jgi:hypothetical protein
VTHRQVACKSIRVTGGNDDIMKEVQILGALKHVRDFSQLGPLTI